MHVVARPPLDEATEQNVVEMMSTATNIIDQLKETSSRVKDLMHELTTPVTKYRRGVIEDQLRLEFLVALNGNVSEGMMTPLASMLAHTTAKAIIVVMTKRGRSIVVYVLCTTVVALHNFLELITSGFMDSVFTQMINSQTAIPRTIHVYVTDEDFDLTLSVLSSAQGWLFVTHLLILKLKGISNVTLKLL